MCLGAFECLWMCGRWLQPLLLVSNEARQRAASLWSSIGLWKHSKEPNKSKQEGRESCLHGFAGHLQLLHYSLCLSACSGNVPVQGRGFALCHLQCCLMQVDYLQVASRFCAGKCNQQWMRCWAAGMGPCQSSRCSWGWDHSPPAHLLGSVLTLLTKDWADTVVVTDIYFTASLTSPLLLDPSLLDLASRVHIAVHLLWLLWLVS